MSFGRTIRDLRETRGLTLHELATRARIPWATLQQIEQDLHFPRVQELERLLHALETTFSTVRETASRYSS